MPSTNTATATYISHLLLGGLVKCCIFLTHGERLSLLTSDCVIYSFSYCVAEVLLFSLIAVFRRATYRM